MYGSAALLHRGIYASVRIRAASREPTRSAAAAAASSSPPPPEVVKVLPAGARPCRCDVDDERRTLPSRRRCCPRDDCLGRRRDAAAAAPLDVVRVGPPFCAAVPSDAAAGAAGARTRSLIVVARPGCPECHTVGLIPNTATAAAGQKSEQLRNYGTVTTTA